MGENDFENVKLNSGEQRIILVAAKFRKEVTATVLYLNAHQLDIKCIKVTPYQDGDRIYLDAEQILLVQDAEEYQVKLSKKKQEDIVAARANSITENLRYKFWDKAIPIVAEKVSAFSGKSATTRHYLNGTGGHFNLQVHKDKVRVELSINTPNTDKNKAIFDYLYAKNECNAPPWLGEPPNMATYEWRGCRVLSKACWKGKCFQCKWATMANVTIEYDWGVRQKFRFESFCYGPKSCKLYKMGKSPMVPYKDCGSFPDEHGGFDDICTERRGWDD